MKNIDSPWGHTTALSARTFVLYRLYPSTPAQPYGFIAKSFSISFCLLWTLKELQQHL